MNTDVIVAEIGRTRARVAGNARLLVSRAARARRAAWVGGMTLAAGTALVAVAVILTSRRRRARGLRSEQRRHGPIHTSGAFLSGLRDAVRRTGGAPLPS